MSASESGSASYTVSPPIQSAQRQEETEISTDDGLESSVEQSPRSHEGSIETRFVEKIAPEVTADDDASSGSLYTPEQHSLHQRSQGPLSPSGGIDTISSGRSSRPNKYHGPPSTWRNWTAAERELAASLQQLTATDLSVHLYNAFHLRRRPEKIREQGGGQHEGGSEGAEAWLPPKVWTAWPLPQDVVPRDPDISYWEEEGDRPGRYYGRTGATSNNLKELLVAYVLKKAKERFWAREWDDNESNGADGNPSRESGSQFDPPNCDSEDLTTSPPATEHTSREGSSSARSGVEDDDVQPRSAEASLRAEDAVTSSGDYLDLELRDFEPEVMVDDDKASDILEPTMNHILAKLDDLLMGLHHARSAYMAPDGSTSEFEIDVRAPRQSKQGKGKPSKSRQGRGRPSICGKSSAGVKIEIAENSRPSSTSRTRSQRTSSTGRKAQSFQSRKARVGLRDWSDVLGIASMIGWESAVVERAATRCATLFEEGISFRTLGEGTDEVREDSYLPKISKRSEVRRLGKGFLKNKRNDDSSVDSSFGPSDESFGRMAHTDSFLQPVEAERHWKRKKRSGQSERQSRQSRKE